MQPPSRRARAGGLPLLALVLAAVVCCCCVAGAAAARSSSSAGQLNGLSRRQAAGGPLHHSHQQLLASNRRRLLQHEEGGGADASAPHDAAAGGTDADSGGGNKHHKKHHHKERGSIDYEDQDPDVRSHWALLVAGSAGWYNYRHQADVFHAYGLLRAGGYRADHIVVMAADDIAHDPENPVPGKVFNRPGGPDVYDGVVIDYRGADVTAETFLAVLGGDAAKVAGKGSGRVVASGSKDKLFVFYSDHGAAGVLGMPNGPFLYADELIKGLKRKHAKGGFMEAVLYIEACESGSMFEGLLGNDLDAYVTTAANAIESSWATYCPSFGGPAAADDSSSSSNAGGSSRPPAAVVPHELPGWRAALLRGMAWLQQQLRRVAGAPDAAADASGARALPQPQPTPQFTTCLGDLYSVAWMENAEKSNLTAETLLQQYKQVKVRTSNNFTYDQGSHVMQYGDLTIDKELAGDYEGMWHNGSVPPSPTATASRAPVLAAAAAAAPGSSSSSNELLQHAGAAALLQRLGAVAAPTHAAGAAGAHKEHHHHRAVEQRDADLVPLAVAALHSTCPKRRAAAAAALKATTAARQGLEAAARAAAAALLRQPGSGHLLAASLAGAPATSQQQQRVLLAQPSQQHSLLLAAGSDAHARAVEALMTGPLPARQAGQPLVDSWDCLRGMVQAWEGRCGQLDQYGMKLTRLFANLCNAGLHPSTLGSSLAAGPCSAASRR